MKKTISCLLAFFIYWTPFMLAWGDAITDSASEGQAEGYGQLSGLNFPGYDPANNNLKLFEGTGSDIDIPLTDLFRDSDGDSTEFSNLYGDNQAGLLSSSNVKHTELSTGDTPTAQAYQVIRLGQKGTAIDVRSDPIWSQTDYVQGNIDTIVQDFTDCTSNTSLITNVKKNHIPDIEVCERILKPEIANCKIYHDFTVKPLITVLNGYGGIESCGHGCMDIYIGNTDDDYLSGNCAIFEEYIELRIDNPNAITSASLSYVKYDDYMQVYLNSRQIYQGPNGNFPPETPGKCELGERWIYYPNVDVTNDFKNYSIQRFLKRVSVGGEGDGYAKIRVTYNPGLLVEDNGWTGVPSGCLEETIEAVDAQVDGFCETGGLTCTNGANTPCYTINNMEICEGDFSEPSPIRPAGILATCQEAEITTPFECNFNVGNMECFVDINGETQCPTNGGELENTCQPLEDDATCAFIDTTCIDGAKTTGGSCLAYTDKYDCGYDVDVETINSEQTVQCEGDIRCMGEECVDVTRTTNQNFGQAVSGMAILDGMSGDNNCGSDDTSECTVFDGESMECKKALGGYKDCCEPPEGMEVTSWSDYIDLAFKMERIDTLMYNLDTYNTLGHVYSVQGSSWWQSLQSGYDTVTSMLTDTMTSIYDSIAAPITDLFADLVKDTVIDTISQTLSYSIMQNLAMWSADLFGAAAANSVFAAVGGGAAVDATGQLTTSAATSGVTFTGVAAVLASIVTVIMILYLVYQIFNIIVDIVWACEAEEFELLNKIEARSCHYVGDYCRSELLGACIEVREVSCCYESPLSRIVMEQVYLQPHLGLDWGKPSSANCQGLTISQLDDVHWEDVDMSEWVAILYDEEIIPSVSNGLEAGFGIDSVTGSGNWITEVIDEQDRLDTGERTNERLDGHNLEDAKREITDYLLGLTPSPPP